MTYYDPQIAAFFFFCIAVYSAIASFLEISPNILASSLAGDPFLRDFCPDMVNADKFEFRRLKGGLEGQESWGPVFRG